VPVARKTVAKKTAKKSASKPAADPVKGLVADIATAVIAGDLDAHLTLLDDALTTRANARAAETAKKTAAAPAEKKVSAPPKKGGSSVGSTGTKAVVPVESTVYLVSDRLKNLAGAKVEFVRYKPGDENKAVVVMKTEKPGSPRGKRVVIPVAALVEDATAKKTPARKSAAKPLAKKVAAKKKVARK
jgi:hypothetical protein